MPITAPTQFRRQFFVCENRLSTRTSSCDFSSNPQPFGWSDRRIMNVSIFLWQNHTALKLPSACGFYCIILISFVKGKLVKPHTSIINPKLFVFVDSRLHAREASDTFATADKHIVVTAWNHQWKYINAYDISMHAFGSQTPAEDIAQERWKAWHNKDNTIWHKIQLCKNVISGTIYLFIGF